MVVEVVIEHDEEACRLLKHTGIGGERVNLRKFHQVGELTCKGVDGDQCRRFCVGVDSVWSLDAEECFHVDEALQFVESHVRRNLKVHRRNHRACGAVKLDELLISGVIHSHQGIDVVVRIKCGSPKDDPVDAFYGGNGGDGAFLRVEFNQF